MASRLFLPIFSVLAIAAAACSNPLKATANLKVFDDTLSAFGISDAPPNGPTALNTAAGRVVAASPANSFDLVFDIRPGPGGVKTGYVLPPKTVAQFGNAGLIRDSTRAFDAITQAPGSGYDDSTAVAVKPGDVLLVQAVSSACSGNVIAGRQFIYSKMVIDRIDTSAYDPIANPAGNTIYFRIRVDPNCGFLSFANGIPTF